MTRRYRHRRPARGKCGKIMYRDEVAAKLTLAETSRRGRDEIRVYECNICYGHVWHVTSGAKKTEKRTGSIAPQSIDEESSRLIA